MERESLESNHYIESQSFSEEEIKNLYEGKLDYREVNTED